MYLLILFFPLISSIISGLCGFQLGNYYASRFSSFCVLLAFLLSIFAFYEIALSGGVVYVKLFSWIDSSLFNLDWEFLFDTLTAVMLVVVTTISLFVHIYSIEYMENDPNLSKFMSYLSLFTFFMLILVTGANFLQLFLGWEGVGLCSYLLINFWYTRLQANKAAIKAMIVNRIGDFGLALGIFTIYYFFRTLDYETVFAMVLKLNDKTFSFFHLNFNILDFICFFLFVGCMGKSAQIGLHTWLPDAMEGPTPVSALIHAATMVTAGVFLIARCSPLFEYAENALLIVTLIGGSTAFLGATIGLVQNDLKRVIAYSTCSQLGYMIFSCGVSGYNVGIFHLSNHAFFKALLFLSAGSVIHALSDEQDMRKMGGLARILPYTYSMFLIGSLALMGFPFLAGFYSKDIILEVAYGNFEIKGHFVFWLGTLSAFFTAFYSIRLLSLTFLRPTNAFKHFVNNAHECGLYMGIPLYLLSLFSIFIGFLTKDMMIGLGTNFWGNSIYLLPKHLFIVEGEWLGFSTKILPLMFSLTGALLSFIFYNFFYSWLLIFNFTNIGLSIYNFLNRKWFFDKLNNEVIAQHLLNFSYKHSYQNLDRGIIELLGPNGISLLLYQRFSMITNFQMGFLFSYIFLLLTSVLIISFFLGFWYINLSFICLSILLITLLIIIFI